MKKQLVLLRHGKTLFNETNRIQGWCDSPLTEAGKEQARMAGKKLSEMQLSFDHVYSSTSERCCDTLELAGYPDYVRLKGLKEMNFGCYEGQPEYLHPPFEEFLTFYKTKGGESGHEVARRMKETIDSIMEQEDHSCVLIGTHAGSIMNFLSACQLEPASHRIPNCALIVLEYEDGTYRLNEITDPMEGADQHASV